MDVKVSLTTKNGMTLHAEGKPIEVFKQLDTLQEIFSHDTCGKCGGHNLRFRVRSQEGNDFYEMVCETKIKNNKPDESGLPCRAKLAFGVHKSKEGTLFPKKKDGETWLPDGGWVRWNSQTKKEE